MAFSSDERAALEELLERGRENGIEGLAIIEREDLREREPNISSACVAALWVPTGAIVNPYGAALAFAENAAVNGVRFAFDTEVTGIAGHAGAWTLDTVKRAACIEDHTQLGCSPDTVDARYIVNAAGAHAGMINALVSTTPVPITPRVGEYHLLDTAYGAAFRSTIFQTPTAAGKGVLVTPTTGGNLMIGPNADLRESLDDVSTKAADLDAIMAAAGKTWEHIPRRGVITNFAGTRASTPGGDFVLGEPDDAPGFYNVAAIDSPGLTAAPAIAADVARFVGQALEAGPRMDFVATRSAPACFRTASDGERARLVAANPAYGHVVCRCEKVTEGEIVDALHSPVPARTVDAVKWRTRAGMGRCQSGFCMPLVAEIIARETGCRLCEVDKGKAGSYLD